MNKSLHNTENPSNNGSDQAHAAWSSYARAAQQQATRPPPQTQPYTKNSHKPKEFNTTNNYNTGSVKLPAAPSTETVIQFGSVNQSSQGGKTGDAPVIKDSPSASPVDSQRANIRSNPKPEIPRSPRSTNDGRLFTQSFAPRRDLNQDYNQNRTYNKPYQQRQMGGYQQPQYPVYTQPSPQQQNISIHHRSPNMSNYTKKSPHLPNSSPQPTWAATGQYYFPPQYQVPAYVPTIAPAVKKSIPIINPETGATIVTQEKPTASPLPKEEKQQFFKIPPATSKRLNIVNPAAKETEELAAAEKKRKEEEEKEKERLEKERLEKERLEKERLEQERLEKERLEKERLEQERLEKERLEKERLEQERLEKERLEKERLEQERLEKERLEKERLEREEKERKEREEKERLEREEKEKAEREEKEKAEREEKERLLAEEKKKKEEELKEIERTRIIRKAEEDELKRIAEQEAKKREGDRAVDIASQKLGRSPNPIDISPIPSYLTQSPVSSPIEKPRVVTRVLEDPSEVQYPPNVTAAPTKSKKELGKYVYETEFLLQFQALCLQTTADLSAMKELIESANNKSNSGMQRRQTSERNRSGRNQQQNHTGGDAMYKMGSRDGGRMEMGKFNMGRPLTSRNASGYNEQLISGGSGRGGSSRGRGGMKVTRNPPQLQGAPTIPVEQVAPLEKTENRWVPGSITGTAPAVAEGDLVPKEIIIKKVNALLNKLTLEKFDSISQQIFDYANQSTKEEDGKSLRTVIRLMFEKACDEPAFAAMWARLARFIHDKISDDVVDVNIVGKDGNVVKGKALYRKYLLNRCQIEFEKGWKVNMPEVKDGEMLTDEYYAAAKAKRQGLGLIAYIGEAYKMDMLSHKIMLSCFIRLCDDPSNISDEEAESLCKLIKTAGQKFDKNPVSHNWMETLIVRIKNEMMFSPNLSSRIKFMLQDILDLRKSNWVPRGGAAQAGPTTIAKIHEMAEKANEEKEAALKRGNSNRGNFIPNNNHNMSRSGSHRGGGNSGSGGGRDFQSFKSNYNNNNNSYNNNNGGNGGDGWNTVGNTSPGGPNKTRVSELSNFGKLDRSRSKSSTLSPGNSPFASLTKNKSFSENKESLEGRASPARNMFSALLGGRDEEKREEAAAPESAPEPEPKVEKLSDEAVHRKTKNILEEYFSIRDKTELTECVKELDDPHYKEILVSEMLTVVEKKESDVEQMCDVVKHLDGEGLLEKSSILDAFKTFMEGYDDLTIDVPQAHKYVAQLLIAFKLSPSDVGGEEFAPLEKAYNELKDD